MTNPIPDTSLAPRPMLQLLPLHLQTSMTSFLYLQSVLQSASGASSNWSAKSASGIGAANFHTIPEPLRRAILREALKRQQEALQGVQSYLHYSRNKITYPIPPGIVWEKHSARLYHYAANDKKKSYPLLVVPSLINRYYILDLSEKRSLVRYLAAQGYDVYLLDWGTPGSTELGFNISDYVMQILTPAAQFIHKNHESPLGLIGYCMGGLIALALTRYQPGLIQRMALLATPWHFHAADAEHLQLSVARSQALREMLHQLPFLPGESILYLFYLSDPWRFQEKFREFPTLKTKEDRDYFSAIEIWANDCVPLPREVAVQCFLDCQQENQTYLRKWTVGEYCVDPLQITVPTLIAAPQHDRIVPQGSAVALAKQLPNAKLLNPKTGHIGMITGTRRLSELWRPLITWFASI